MREKNVTGRQLARVSSVKYRETIWSELYAGNRHTISCFQPAVTGAEKALELEVERRKRTVWRMDGGSGSDEQLQWLLERGYHVVAKGYSNTRAYALARQVSRWDSYGDYELAEVSPSLGYRDDARFFVKRRRKDGRWVHSYYVSTLVLPSKGQFLSAYHQRGGAEVEQFRQDKQGLHLADRRKSSFFGQQAYVFLTDLAHNLLAHFRHHALCGTPFESFGFKRIVRDLLHIPGNLFFDNGQLSRVELLSTNPNSHKLLICLENYLFSQ